MGLPKVADDQSEEAHRIVCREEDERRLFDVARQIEDERLALRGTSDEMHRAGPARPAVEDCLRALVDRKTKPVHRAARARERANLGVAVVPRRTKPERRDDPGMDDVELAASAHRADASDAVDAVDGDADFIEPLDRSERQRLRRPAEGSGAIRKNEGDGEAGENYSVLQSYKLCNTKSGARQADPFSFLGSASAGTR